MLGFRPVSSLADHHQLREPTFAYPSETLLQGSTAAFIAVFEEARPFVGHLLSAIVISHVSFLWVFDVP